MSFESRVRAFAAASGLVVTEATEDSAVFFFYTAGTDQVLQITPYDEVWEFACVSSLSEERGPFGDRFEYSLMRNSHLKRVSWAIREVGAEEMALVCMANFPVHLLTSEEFKCICWAVVRETADGELAALVSLVGAGEEAG